MSYLKNDDYEKDKAELLRQFNVYKSIAELMGHENNDESINVFLKFTNKMIDFVQQSKWNGDTSSMVDEKTEETCSSLMSKLLDAAEKEKRACVCAFTSQEDNFTAETGMHGDIQHVVGSIVSLIKSLSKNGKLTSTKALAMVNFRVMTDTFIEK